MDYVITGNKALMENAHTSNKALKDTHSSKSVGSNSLCVPSAPMHQTDSGSSFLGDRFSITDQKIQLSEEVAPWSLRDRLLTDEVTRASARRSLLKSPEPGMVASLPSLLRPLCHRQPIVS